MAQPSERHQLWLQVHLINARIIDERKTYKYMYIYVCMYVCIYIYLSIYLFIYVCICIQRAYICTYCIFLYLSISGPKVDLLGALCSPRAGITPRLRMTATDMEQGTPTRTKELIRKQRLPTCHCRLISYTPFLGTKLYG